MRKIELVNLLDPAVNKDYGNDGGEFARVRLETTADGTTTFIGERTLGVPARYALQELPKATRVIVAHTIREIRDAWNVARAEQKKWTKPFDRGYTVMWPALHKVRVRIPVTQPTERGSEWILSDQS